MELLVPLIIIGVVAAIVVAVIHHYKRERERREALHRLAQELGWRFDPGRDRSHDDEYAHFEIFRRGHSRAAYNTLTGQLDIMGRPFNAKMGDFTYKVTTSNGKTTQTTTYRFSYLIVHLPFVHVPALIIRQEGLFDRVAGFFGFGSIDFESAAFNRQFYVNGEDKKFAYDVIHPRMMEFLMQTRPPAVDIERGRLCLSNGRRRWSPEQYRSQIVWLEQFFAQWPAHVQAELQSRETA
ncbi:MAG: hypothetical protein WD009_10505 [Phycisphaeraceae bacterium]